MENIKTKSIIEALIFSQENPLSEKMLAKILEKKEDVIKSAICELKEDFKDRAIELTNIAGGWKFQTKKEFFPWIEKLSPSKKIKLSKQALVTLAIIAYNQPITRQGIERIRGVDSHGAINSLLDCEFVEIAGVKKSPGNPFLYRTTKKFLLSTGLPDISALPKIE
ncbi:MAG: SMC-Scp complex subunit ScpB [bacterium]